MGSEKTQARTVKLKKLTAKDTTKSFQTNNIDITFVKL